LILIVFVAAPLVAGVISTWLTSTDVRAALNLDDPANKGQLGSIIKNAMTQIITEVFTNSGEDVFGFPGPRMVNGAQLSQFYFK
jgi:hypothetical protein